jgi:Flp pilus assembly protein TadD
MTNEEAKELYVKAIKAIEAKEYESALSVFDQLDAERPNSRHVTYNRVICLANLGRKHEARSNLEKIEGKLEADKTAELKRLLTVEQAAAPAAAQSGAADEGGANELVIESAFPKSNDETTITGHIKSGAFRTGDSLTIVTPDGMPIVAPIVRIGTAETPLKMARAGQKAIMLLQVESHHVVPGSSATCVSQEESYAETMVVGVTDEAGPASSASQMDGALMEIDRQIRSGDTVGALQKLQGHLATEPDSCAVHRLLAKVYLEGGDAVLDPPKALEHIRKAYELGGAEDPVVVDLLAKAMAANGEAEHGLRFLERLYAGTNEFEAKGALGQRIVEFRSRNNLGHIWEFSDNYGDVIFESSDIGEIARAIQSNTVPKSSLCKKDHVGEWRKVEETLALENETIGALFKEKEGGGGGGSLWLYVIIGLLVAIIVAVLFMTMGGTPAEG